MALSIPLDYPWIGNDPLIAVPGNPQYVFDNMYYPMRGVRCIHVTAGKQCSRRSIYTIPVCWQHLKSDYHIIVGQTTLTDGNGVRLTDRGIFACDPTDEGGLVFRANDVIVPYIGANMTMAQHEARYPGDTVAPYSSMPLGNNRIIDAGPMRGVASLANDCRTVNRLRGDCERNNARLIRGGAGYYPKLTAIRAIYDGDEIFVSYGNEYWTGIHKPVRTQSSRNAYNKLKYKCGRR